MKNKSNNHCELLLVQNITYTACRNQKVEVLHRQFFSYVLLLQKTHIKSITIVSQQFITWTPNYVAFIKFQAVKKFKKTSDMTEFKSFWRW